MSLTSTSHDWSYFYRRTSCYTSVRCRQCRNCGLLQKTGTTGWEDDT